MSLMKILLVCNAGMSTSMLMKKMLTYGQQKQMDLHVEAHAVQEFEDYMGSFDVALLGPQISYKSEEVRSRSTIPVGVINSMDYAIGNAEKIIKQAQNLVSTKES